MKTLTLVKTNSVPPTAEVNWGLAVMSPPFMAFSFQMAALQLLMKPENQLAMWRSFMDPRNYQKGCGK
jgi:hypothetical protein